MLLACLAVTGMGAEKSAHIGYLYPAGGLKGTTFEITAGGQYLKGATNAFVSGSGVKVSVLSHIMPLTNQEKQKIREGMREQQKALKGKKTSPQKMPKSMQIEDWPDDLRDLDFSKLGMADLSAVKKMLYDPKRQPNAQIAEIVRLSVSIATDAKLGSRELRLLTKAGLSNPIVLNVDPFPECQEREPNEKEATVVKALPAVLNGQVMPGDVDRFRFRARKGQKIVAAVRARALIPYLADAVPGWFQAVLALHDAEGKELAFVDDYRFDPDPVLRFEIQKDGEYELLIRDSIYRGREDFVYRIVLGQLPFVESIFPLGARVGESLRVALHGWNLPADHAVLKLEKRSAGLHEVSVPGLGKGANRVACALDSLEELLEREPNNISKSAQRVRLPITVNGRIQRPGDQDVFRFEGREGQKVAAEVLARRLNSPVDSILKLTDASGREIAVNDDYKDPAAGLTTHHADSRLMATLPAGGTYYLHVGDTQGVGGATHGYRLRISPPRPDFKLRLVPSSISIYPGATVALIVVAIRRDGFAGDIRLELKNAPSGFILSGASIPAGSDRVPITLTAPREFPSDPMSLRIVGAGTVGDRQVTRPVVPAEDMMQAFLWRHLVTTEELMLTRLPRRWKRPPVKLESGSPVELAPGGTVRVAFRSGARNVEKGLEMDAVEGPEGLTVKTVTPVAGGADVILEADAEKLKPGQRGNLVLEAFCWRDARDKKGKPAGKKRRVPLGTVPAVSYKITAK